MVNILSKIFPKKPTEKIYLYGNIGKSPYFKWVEMLLQRRWGEVYAPSEKEKAEIIKTIEVLDKIRSIFNSPMLIHSGIRSKDYNKFIGGASRSAHLSGKAVDFSIQGVSCDKARNILLPRLKNLGIRMEDNPGSNWIHIDRKPVIFRRFFKP